MVQANPEQLEQMKTAQKCLEMLEPAIDEETAEKTADGQILMIILLNAIRKAVETEKLPIEFQITDDNPTTKELAQGYRVAHLCEGIFGKVDNQAASGRYQDGAIKSILL